MGKRRGGGRNPDPISEKKAVELDVASKLESPIAELDRIRRSLLFAEISMLSYLPDDEATPVFESVGFDEVVYVERDGAQAYLLANDVDLVVVCRGTEPNEWNDVRADANAFTDLAETVGRVHRGFKREVDDIWPTIEERLTDETRDMWFCGHSLGGAMAQICAARAAHLGADDTAKVVFTFGSPRVGTKKYIRNNNVEHYRWVNNNDIVTRVPPTLFGYGHRGILMYIDSNGVHRHLTPALRGKDRWAGFWQGLKQRKFDHFSDHAIAAYVQHIRAAEPPPPTRGLRFRRRRVPSSSTYR